jgi:hypothetical protein
MHRIAMAPYVLKKYSTFDLWIIPQHESGLLHNMVENLWVGELSNHTCINMAFMYITIDLKRSNTRAVELKCLNSFSLDAALSRDQQLRVVNRLNLRDGW